MMIKPIKKIRDNVQRLSREAVEGSQAHQQKADQATNKPAAQIGKADLNLVSDTRIVSNIPV